MQDVKNVPVFILAGGLGTRISEETDLKPKPMIEIGNIPILVHIMRYYYSFGFDDFVICAGYRSWEIKDYFLNYQFRQNHLIVDHRKDNQSGPVHSGQQSENESWRVRVIETGLETMTGARLAKAYDFVSQTEKFDNFAVTYGDGLTDVNLLKEFEFHTSHKSIGTVLGVPPVSRFGEMDISSNGKIKNFIEKPAAKKGTINGGFFFFKNDFRKYLTTDVKSILEREPLESAVKEGQIYSFEHRGFWQCMDTLRDKLYLQSLWDSGNPPWLRK